MKWLFFNLLSILSLIAAFVLAYNQLGGWGWFLFIAILSFVYPSQNDSDDSKSSILGKDIINS